MILGRRSTERFSDDTLGFDSGTEKQARYIRNFRLLFCPGITTGKCGRSPYMDQSLCFTGLTKTADQHSDVGSLPAAIRMELIQDKES